MAHFCFHFACGLSVGMLLWSPPIVRALRAGEGIARHLGRWIVFSYALAIAAIIPTLLAAIGVPEAFCRGWWMNIFLLHPLLDHWLTGEKLTGELLIVGWVAIQYASLVAASTRRKT